MLLPALLWRTLSLPTHLNSRRRLSANHAATEAATSSGIVRIPLRSLRPKSERSETACSESKGTFPQAPTDHSFCYAPSARDAAVLHDRPLTITGFSTLTSPADSHRTSRPHCAPDDRTRCHPQRRDCACFPVRIRSRQPSILLRCARLSVVYTKAETTASLLLQCRCARGSIQYTITTTTLS